ncbi:MAG: ankyrin repeat domain-containing protein [Polyangiales bacterium]
MTKAQIEEFALLFAALEDGPEAAAIAQIRALDNVPDDTLRELLQCAIRARRAVAVFTLVEAGAVMDESMVHFAKRSGAAYIGKQWARALQAPRQVLQPREKDLLRAVDNSDSARVEALLREGADAFCVRHKDDLPAFHNAVFVAGFMSMERSSAELVERARDVVRVFCAAGADINQQDSMGSTPLLYAFQVPLMHASEETAEQELRLVRLLVEAGASPSLPDKRGRSALHAWAASGHVHQATLDYLLQAGADIDAQDNQGRGALHVALTQRGDRPSGDAMGVLLLEAGATSRLGEGTDQSARMICENAERRARARSPLTLAWLLGHGAKH